MALQLNANHLQNVRQPSQNDIIYKDECIFSFDSPESKTGLYISLASFLAFGEDYYKLYADKTNNSVFLHHLRTKKEVEKTEEEEPEKKITRLAIGVDGGFSADAGPKYEYTNSYTIVALPGPIRIPLEDPNLPTAVRLSADAVIAADSSFKRAELEAMEATWDGEVRQVSKYAENLVQLDNGKKLSTSDWKCERCELTTNLWLNLTDGAIVCGRRNFDGSGGNNHGVEHFQNTGYPLAVKLGTISKDGKADVFSYPEDDLVLDPLLVKHLAHFAIDVKNLEKTDKSMAELEIDLNQRVGEWITCQESGSNLVPAYGPGRTGLVNLGNSCYMNSVMQVVFTIPSFVERFVDDYPNLVNNCDYRNPAKDFNIQMGKLGFGLCSGKYSQPPPEGSVIIDQPGISPRMFKHVVAAGNRDFSSNSQQDAQEFVLHLINVLERNSRHKRNPADVFKFRVEDRCQCVESGKVMYTERVEYCLPIPLPLEKATNLSEVEEYQKRKEQDPKTEIVRPLLQLDACVEALAEAELVDKFYSSALGRYGQARKTIRLTTFPDYLLVYLKKFALQGGQVVKVDVAVDVPQVLDLSKMKGLGLQPGEESLPVESGPAANLNMEIINELVDMGCPLEAAKRATFNTEGAGLLQAYTWYEQHLGDADIMAPFVVPGTQPTLTTVDESAAEMIMCMGFTRAQAVLALRNTDNNVERACDWILSHPEEAADSNEPASDPSTTFTDGEPKYRLRAFITHMGTSAAVGHYVCHILQDGHWLIFNDNKVAFSQNPPKDLGYLYLYERIKSSV